MKTIKKILMFSLIIVSFVLVSCVNEPIDDNNQKGEINLPNIDSPIKAIKEEIIYVSLKQNGTIDNIKASNKITEASFSYYEDYGSFLEEGNLNISSNNGKIIVNEIKALIPSLNEQNNFYYILSLNKDYYKNLLPFNIDIKYFLDGEITSYQELKGESGTVDMVIKFSVNEGADEYFKTMYGAQIQIPFDSEKVEILNAENALTKVVVAKTITLAYMAMPGQNLEINLKLKVNDFSFAGLEATFQEFRVSDLLNSYINIEQIDLSNITKLKEGLREIILEFSNAKTQTDQLFYGLSLLTEESISNNIDIEELSRLNELINALNSNSFKQGYTLPSLAIKYVGISNRDTYVSKYKNLEVIIENEITKLTNSHLKIVDLLTQIDEIINNLQVIKSYSETYLEFEEIIINLNAIKNKLNSINLSSTLEELILNKEHFKTTFNDIGLLNNKIKNSFQTLILETSTLPYHLSELSCLFDLFKELTVFSNNANNLKNVLNNLTTEIKSDIENNIFSSIYLSGLNQFLDALEGESEDALIPVLEFLVEKMNNEDQTQDIEEFLNLLKKDDFTKRRLIDDVVRGFIEMNKALTTVLEGEQMSFYDSLSLIALIGDLLELVPEGLIAPECERRSFLSEKNLPPSFIQFIIKQQPF